MVQSADDAAVGLDFIPWELLDVLARMLSIPAGSFLLIVHEGSLKMIVPNWQESIHLDPKDDRSKSSDASDDGAPGSTIESIIEFVMSSLAKWTLGEIGPFGTVEVLVEAGRVKEVKLTRARRRMQN